MEGSITRGLDHQTLGSSCKSIGSKPLYFIGPRKLRTQLVLSTSWLSYPNARHILRKDATVMKIGTHEIHEARGWTWHTRLLQPAKDGVISGITPGMTKQTTPSLHNALNNTTAAF